MKMIQQKKGLGYDWLDFIGSLLFLVGGILLAFLLIAANRLQSVDTKYVLTEKVEIMDQTAYFMNLPVSQIDINSFALSAQERAYLELASNQNQRISDLFLHRMIDDEANAILEEAIASNPLFEKYKITIEALPDMGLERIDFEQFSQSIRSANGTAYEMPSHPIEPTDQTIETRLHCSFNEAIKQVTFTLPLPLHPDLSQQLVQIQYCHRVRYFEND